jgi:hypothetical protein
MNVWFGGLVWPFCAILTHNKAQNIKLWSQKNPLLGKYVPTNAQPTTEGHPLLGNGPVNRSHDNE